MPYGTTHLEMGRRIQIIRERTALTQKDVAQFLSVTPKTASNWESGRTSISEEHLRSLIRLLLSHHAFSPGREGKEEIVALWKQAQACSSAIKELDHVWLSTQLRSRKQWEGIMELPVFFGRKTELAHLTQWITHEHSRLVTIFGVGGIGKTTLATKLAQDLAFQFECVLWHSLQYVPSIEDFVADCIQMLVEEEEQAAFSIPLHLDQRLACFLHLLRTRRCLLILDNFESLLREDTLGVYQPGFEGYQRLIELVVKSPHKSCLVITSREAPQHLRNDFPVRLLPLGSLNVTACQDLLREKSLQGTAAEWEQLIACYGGNPLGLKIVAEEIQELFDGSLSRFFHRDQKLVGGMRQLLDLQFQRFSSLELEIMEWLALEREPITVEELTQNIPHALVHRVLPDILGALRRRCFVERGPHASFYLLPVVQEYLTERLLTRISGEIQELDLTTLTKYPLLRTSSKESIRHSQIRLLLQPLLDRLVSHTGGEHERVEALLLDLVQTLRARPLSAHGYAAGNLLNLLATLRAGNLRQLDFSHLAIRHASLVGIDAQDASFAYAQITESLFSDAFAAISSIAFSTDSTYMASGHVNKQIRLWRDDTLVQIIDAHPFVVWSVAFSPDTSYLVSGGYEGEVKLWQVATGLCRRVHRGHSRWIRSIAMHPEGRVFATGSDDGTVRIWTPDTCLHILQHHTAVWSVSFSPNGRLLAGGTVDGAIRIWEVDNWQCVKIIQVPSGLEAIAFSPDGRLLASAGMDGIITLWDLSMLDRMRTIKAHAGKVLSIAFSPDGHLLASGSHNGEVKVWSIEEDQYCLLRTFLEEGMVWSVAFSPDGRMLTSGNNEGVLKKWSVSIEEQGTHLHAFRTLRGYSHVISAIAFSPDGRHLAYGDSRGVVTMMDCATQRLSPLQAHTLQRDGHINTVAFSPDGRLLVSGSDDTTIKIWQIATGLCLKTLTDHKSNVWSVTFSPDGKLLASSSATGEIRLWQVATGQCLQTFLGHTSWVWSVTFSPDGALLASGSMSGEVRLWQVATGQCLHILPGHGGPITDLRFSAHGATLISTSDKEPIKIFDLETGAYLKIVTGQEAANWLHSSALSSSGRLLASKNVDGTMRIVDVSSGDSLQKLRGDHGDTWWSAAWSPDELLLASGDDHGALRLFRASDGQLMWTVRQDRQYERMNITNVVGLHKAQRMALHMLGAVVEKPP